MNQENRNYRSQSSRQDPYEKGFAHKLYENDIGPEPTYRGEQTSYTRGAPVHNRPAPKKNGSFLGKVFTFLLICAIFLGIG